MIIDFHTHAWPQKVAQKAQENLESLFKLKLVAHPTLESLLFFMKKNSIDTSVVCAVATRPEQVPSINDWLFGVRSDSIRVYCALHPEYADWKNEVERISAQGDGVKFQPEFQDFYVDDKKIFPLYAALAERDVPVLFHCGEELSQTMLVRSSPERLIKVKRNFPRLKIIGAHFGGFQLWDEVRHYLNGADIYLDTAFVFGYVPPEKIRKMMLEYRTDRLLFGTDFPLRDQRFDLEHLAALKLPREVHEQILFLNARELLKRPAAALPSH